MDTSIVPRSGIRLWRKLRGPDKSLCITTLLSLIYHYLVKKSEVFNTYTFICPGTKVSLE
jgi:hypothetical protein